MGSLVGREELRRLEKAAREKDKKKLIEWLTQFENQVNNNLRIIYETMYQDEVQNSVQNALTAIVYSLYYSEETYIDKDNLADFMSDLFITLDMFRTGEYTPKDYEEELAKENIFVDKYDSDKIFKKYLEMYDTDLVRYLRGNPRKIIYVCGKEDRKDEIFKFQNDLSIQGNIVYIDNLLYVSKELLKEERANMIRLNKDKILISNDIYIIGNEPDKDDVLKTYIDYAKEHNKNISYFENID